MRWAGDERRLGQACQAVLEFMQRHAIAASWAAPTWVFGHDESGDEPSGVAGATRATGSAAPNAARGRALPSCQL